MIDKKVLQALVCAGVATILALTTHIYISEWMNPILDSMSQGIDMNPNSTTYSSIIMYAAYGTAFITIGVLVFLYYHAQHLIPGKSHLMKTVIVTLILFGIKGEPIRQPIMNLVLNYTIGLKNPFLFVVLQQMDKWLALFLLAACLVYLCPKKFKA